MENGVSHNPQGLLWEELLKKNRLTLHRRIRHCHFSLYSTRGFLNKGLKALSTRHLFLMCFLFSGPCFPLFLFLRHLVISAFYFGPIIFTVTSPCLERSPWWPQVRSAVSLSTHRARERPQGYTHCIQTSWGCVETEGWSGDSKPSGKKLIDSPYISKPGILFQKQKKKTFFFPFGWDFWWCSTQVPTCNLIKNS